MFKIAVYGEALYIDRNNLYVSSKGIIITLFVQILLSSFSCFSQIRIKNKLFFELFKVFLP